LAVVGVMGGEGVREPRPGSLPRFPTATRTIVPVFVVLTGRRHRVDGKFRPHHAELAAALPGFGWVQTGDHHGSLPLLGTGRAEGRKQAPMKIGRRK
jgi:hypothetical protein